ncbi:M20 family metallopeptidase [Roseateles toxinivorans]|uniref:Glutamate carboxypeptidase n=1 Tax=Roseateles toxinivorans TaxID=270368 RepID=A0A4R6QEE7_9BURK|nr:M20 family metallopeptidase [Roseateles toxinivorans]TDP61254.1 glutamate carboxypeptidase [Roseateles toxinivorans]
MPTAPALNVDEILAGIRAWIEIESPTDDPDGMARMAARVQADYEAIGVRVERIAGRDGFGDHLLAIDDRHCPPDAAAGPGVLVLSHIDTVHPIGTLAGPLPFRIEGDRAYGPGAEDMKGGTYLALAALRQLAREGLKTHLPVRHLMVSDEETGSDTSREHIEREAQRAKFVLVTEPARSGGKVVTARKGIANFVITAHGLAAHAGVEHHLGRNAIREIAHQVLTLEAMTDYARELTVNVGAIKGGTRSNVVPDSATIEVDVRLPNPEIGEEIVRRIRSLQPQVPGVTLTIEGGINRPGYEKTPGIAALYEHAKTLAAEIGFELVDLKTGGGSDGNYTAAIAPTLDGLGVDGDGAHTLDERLYISSIIPRARLLMRLMETLK